MQASSLPADQDKAGSKKMWWFRIGAALTLAVLGIVLYTYRDQSLPKVSPLDPKPASQSVPVDNAGSQAANASTPTLANAVATAAALATNTLEPAVTVVQKQGTVATMSQPDMAQVLDRLSKLEAAVDLLTGAVNKLSLDFAAWVSGHAKPEAIADNKLQIEPAPMPRKKPRRKAAPAPMPSVKEQAAVAAPVERAPEVLSIDSWNGQSSVVVRTGSSMQFLREGDRAGSYTLKRADKEGQRAFFVAPSGELTVKNKVEQ